MTALATMELDAATVGTERMRARVADGVGWMVFNNPARRNAVGVDMWEAIPRILAAFNADPAVRLVALTGEGDRAFVAGADISQFETQRASPEAIARYDAVGEAASRALKDCPKPTVAVIRGWCIGGGVGIASCCDLRYATEGSKFGIPAGRLGLGYGVAGVKTLLDLVGPAFARELFYTARHFTAAEAVAMGLVNRAVPDEGFDGFIAEQLAGIAENAPLTLAALKRTVSELLRGSGGDLDAASTMVSACFESADYAEGRRAFMEKRRPVFQGR